MERKTTQLDMVLKFMIDYGSITQLQAIQELGVTRLSAVIYKLKNKFKLPIKSEWFSVTSRYGETRVKRYILEVINE